MFVLSKFHAAALIALALVGCGGSSPDSSGASADSAASSGMARSLSVSYRSNLITLQVTGPGELTGGSGSLDCGAGSTMCSRSFPSATDIHLKATAAYGKVLLSWGGDCSGTAAVCTIDNSKARNVTATFGVAGSVPPTPTPPPAAPPVTPPVAQPPAPAPVKYMLSVSSATGGAVTSAPAGISCGNSATQCGASFASGTVITLNATSLPGYAFSGWSGACSGSSICSTTLSQAVSVTANFVASAPPVSTPPTSGDSFTFLAYGDSRAGSVCDANAVHMGLVAKMAAEPADFVFNVGDMVAGMDSTTNWTQRGACTADASRGSLKEIIAPLQGKKPAAGLPTFYFPVVGNHDDNWGDGWYPDKFGNGFCDVFTPASFIPNHTQNKAYFADWKSSGVTHYTDTQFYSLMCSKATADADKVYSKYMYYSFDYKNSHFAVMRLNSDYVDLMECGGSCSDPNDYDMYYNKHQLDWLRYDLAQANARGVKNIFVLTHAPLMTTSDGHAANASWPTLLKEFSKDKVKIVFSGHAHVYERSYGVTTSDASPSGVRDDTNGTVYNVTGGGGSYPDGFSRSSSLSAVRASGTSAYHYLRVDVTGSKISVKAIGLDGKVIDSYTR